MDEAEAAALTPHHFGHRERLRERFRKGGAAALADYELLELILFRAMPRRDVKPIAKALIARFGSYAEALAARPERLAEVAGLGEAAITDLKIVEAAARRLAQSAIEKRKNLGSTTAVIDYCRTAMAFLDREEFTRSLSKTPSQAWEGVLLKDRGIDQIQEKTNVFLGQRRHWLGTSSLLASED